jgi:hypothetical protein
VSIESIEASEQDGAARELIDISHGTIVYRITTATRDITQDGWIYQATATGRGEIGVPSIEDDDMAIELTLPVNHAFVKRYVQQFAPPQRITVRVRRLYEGGEIEMVWLGQIVSMTVDDEGTEATFRVPAQSNDASQRLLPTLSIGRPCPYILYGPGCEVEREASVDGLAHKVTTTVLHVNGRDVRVDLLDTDRLSGWAAGGELVVTGGTAIGERMSIREQIDLGAFSSVVDLSLRSQIPGLKVGDAVEVYAGCDRTIDGDHGCGPKFDNKDNFGGSNLMPTENPFWRRR